MPKWLNASVVAIEQLAPNTRKFVLELPDVDSFDFKPGQFITFDLPVHDKRLYRWKSYSIASAPQSSNQFELCIVRMDGGLGTQYLFEQVTVGSTLSLKGPDGAFTLPEKLDKPIVFICTGTGVAPFRSMLRHVQAHGIKHEGLKLIFGTRHADSILYRQEFEAMQHELGHFSYDIVLSRETEWPGYKGHVHQVYEQLSATDLQNSTFYLCGWKNMIDEAVARLQALGVQPVQIIYELYG